MGLAIVHGIVESYGGSISCDQRHGGGTVFTILLPRTAADMPGEAERIEKTPTGKEHILLIDDEEMLVEMGKHLLERLGYRVTTRTSSLEALTTFQNQPDLFDLVITDHTMSGMTGADLARRMLQLRPTLPIILCTGYSDQITENKAKSLGIRGFALKPLTRKDIADLIRTVLDKGKETAQTGTVTPQSPSTRED
jgi:CheY-like chemotaxis protein